ncbi:PAS domain-containing protein [Chloroflexota bacterium]
MKKVIQALKTINNNLKTKRYNEEGTDTSVTLVNKLYYEDQYYKALHSSPNIIAITRIKDGMILDVNDYFANITGYRNEEVIGNNALNLNFWVKPEEREHVVNILLAKGIVKNSEFDFYTKSGEIRTGLLSAQMCNIGEDSCIIFMATDITEQKCAVEALKKSEEKYRDFIDNTNDLIQSVAPDGHFIYVNHSWHETLGYNEDEISNMTIFDIIHPDYLEHCRILFEKVVLGEDVGQLQAVLLGKNGDEIIVKGNVNCKFDNGHPVHTRGIFRNITKARYLEDKVSRLSSALSISTDCVFITDSYSKIVDVNEKTLELYGAKSKDELTNRHFLKFIFPIERQRVSNDVAELIETGNLPCREYNFVDKKGSVIPIQISTSLVRDVSGEPMGIVRVGRKISGLKEQLRKADHLLMQKS